MAELGFKQGGPMNLYFDSTSAIKLSNNPVFHEKEKHVEIDYHVIREKIKKMMRFLFKFTLKTSW